MLRLLKIFGILLTLLLVMIAGPILYVETACRGISIPQKDASYITALEDQRPEARTYLTYPEWHIVYAYEGYSEAINSGAPHTFPYISAVTGFWTSLCALTEKADTLGEAGFDAKTTIYTIGASFTLEMAAKALYEETIGRFATLTGDSPQDQIEADMAAEYATFLQQIPWYKFDFDSWVSKLHSVPTQNLRAYERRFALGLEWKAKAAYARIIARAVAGMTPDALTMKIAVKDIDHTTLNDAKLIRVEDEISIIEVPRYRVFTRLVETTAEQGGTILEIAGNDDILVSMVLDQSDFKAAKGHTLISRTARVGSLSDRILVAVEVPFLHRVFLDYPNTSLRVEHIYDY